jgi:APA family basic amino acid/polyamine antiporter
MTTVRQPGPFARKQPKDLVRDAGDTTGGLKRSVGLLDLTALGIGAVVGTGIFVIIGEAIGKTGPSIVVSFALAGVTCMFSALAYAELASSIPVSGSAYTYSYATLGELAAWIIGWDLIIEYGVAVAGIAVGWGQYFNELLDSAFGWSLPKSIALPPGEGGDVNLPAVFVVLAMVGLLAYGVRETARSNTVMVATKLVVLLIFIVLGATAFKAGNTTPFTTNGFSGIVDAAALIFFAYIGFDAISTAGEEVERPQRDLPLAIIGSLLIVTVLYILVAVVAVGALPAEQLGTSSAPLAAALDDGAGYSWGSTVISIGALIAITSVVLTILYGLTRIVFAMSRDGLLPGFFAKLTGRRTPAASTVLLGSLIAVIAAFVPLTTIAEFVNIGTLFAFVIVNVGVIILRRTQPGLERGFRVPGVPYVPIVGSLLCIYLMTRLEGLTWVRFGVWLVIGLVLYAFYGRKNSRLQRGEDAAAASA